MGLRAAAMDDATLRRVSALAELRVLDTPREQSFDDLVFIAAEAFGAPIALITLLDTDRQWFKARHGVEVCETEIEHSICRIEVERAELLDIVDLTDDERTRLSPMVTGPQAFRSYAGAPLVLRSGAVVGRLCVIDLVPRSAELRDAERAVLLALARQASEQLELRRIALDSTRATELQTALVEIGDEIRASPDTGRMVPITAGIVGQALAAHRVGFGMVDEIAAVIAVDDDWTAPGVASVAGRHRIEDFGAFREPLASGHPVVVQDARADDRIARYADWAMRLGATSLIDVPVREDDGTLAVLFVHSSVPRFWTAGEVAFLRGAADRIEAGMVRQRADQQQRILNGEISHRLKNMLTMVQAIANQTLRDVADRDSVHGFERRLMALSAAHEALLEANWTQADLRTVADAVAETVGFAHRVTMDGPPVALGPRAAFAFSLIVHELLTNACKYGSLSRDGGEVQLTWRVEAGGGDDQLVVRWRETGGPPVAEPIRQGFGSKLIRIGLVGSGGVDLRYEPAGFAADLRASMRHVSRA